MTTQEFIMAECHYVPTESQIRYICEAVGRDAEEEFDSWWSSTTAEEISDLCRYGDGIDLVLKLRHHVSQYRDRMLALAALESNINVNVMKLSQELHNRHLQLLRELDDVAKVCDITLSENDLRLYVGLLIAGWTILGRFGWMGGHIDIFQERFGNTFTLYPDTEENKVSYPSCTSYIWWDECNDSGYQGPSLDEILNEELFRNEDFEADAKAAGFGVVYYYTHTYHSVIFNGYFDPEVKGFKVEL